jgi:hypothetical protein
MGTTTQEVKERSLMTGRTHNGQVVHIGRRVRTIIEAGQTRTLYAPFCQRMSAQTVAYLGKTGEEVTCTKCRKLLATKPHLFG